MRTNSKIGVWNRALLRIGETKLVESEDERRPAAEACGLLWDDAVEEALAAHLWPWATRERQITQIDTQTTTHLYADGVNPWTTWDVPFAFLDADQVTVTHISATAVETVLDADTDYSFPEAVEGSNATVLLASALTAGESLRVDVATTREGWAHVYALPSDCVTPIDLLDGSGGAELISLENRSSFAIMLNDAADGQLLCCDLGEMEFSRLRYVARVTSIGVMPGPFVDALVWRLAADLALALPKSPKMADYFHGRYRAALLTAIDAAEAAQHQTEPPTESLAAR